METVISLTRMREASRELRAAGRRIAFVPTMGALHEGHLTLVRRAGEAADAVVVSVFVNPTQFGPREDYDAYPRDLKRDAAMLAGEEVGILFAPDARDMYPPGHATWVDVEGLSGVLCGASRPGHFRGVATVVAKLFHIVEPDVAVFGAKDHQQAVIIRTMVRDLDLPVEIIVAPTVREPDGVAMSSRNAYLSPAERRAAPVLRRALDEAARVAAGGERESAEIEQAVRGVLDAEPLARVDYVAVVDPETLRPVPRLGARTLVALAVRIGGTRLIDNTVLEPGGPGGV